MRIDVVTLFPELFDAPLKASIIGRAVENGLLTVAVHDLRQHGLGRHRSVDDYPYGGGAGMVLRPEPLYAAIEPLRRARALADREVSIGDYVLTGGELPALVLLDVVARLVPGVIEAASHEDDSFATGLLEYPQYTRPEDFRGMRVPDVLLSGHHGEVDRWRRREALRRTLERRPDLLRSAALADDDRTQLKELGSGRPGADEQVIRDAGEETAEND